MGREQTGGDGGELDGGIGRENKKRNGKMRLARHVGLSGKGFKI